MLPPEGSHMEVNYINLRIKKGYATIKNAKQIKDGDGELTGEYAWGNARPPYRGDIGDPPKPTYEKGSIAKYFPEQTRELNRDTTKEMLYKTAYTQNYSLLHELPYGPWDTDGAMPQWPFQ